MFYTANQKKDRLLRVHALLDPPAFVRDSPEDSAWKSAFIELISLVNDLLRQADLIDQRVDFFDDVGVNGKIQDITSLVAWLYARLPELATEQAGQVASNRLNRYFDAGWGYFANGFFFTGSYADELAFFVNDQRIYLNRHLRRAVNQAEQSLTERTSTTL